jgi:hypothetical protein
MKIAKYLMMALGVLGAVLSIVYKLPSYGTHGLIVLGACLVPVALGILGTVVVQGLPRWASAISAVSFLLAAMKTSKGTELQNIMITATAGLVVAFALLIRPDRPRAASVARR